MNPMLRDHTRATLQTHLTTRGTVFAQINGSSFFIFFASQYREEEHTRKCKESMFTTLQCQIESRYVGWTTHACTAGHSMIYANVTYTKNLNNKLADTVSNKREASHIQFAANSQCLFIYYKVLMSLLIFFIVCFSWMFTAHGWLWFWL